MEPKVVNKGEKWLIYGIFACIDALQVALDFTAVGEIANHFIDIIAAAILLLYGMFRKLWPGHKLLVLLATFIGEQIPFVNALPFWTFDVRNLFSETVTEQQKTDLEQAERPKGGPMYVNGVRMSENSDITPANEDGVRLPNGGLEPPTGKVPMVDIKPPKIS